MKRHLLAIALCMMPFVSSPALAEESSETQKLAMANRLCNTGKVPTVTELTPVSIILVDKKNATTGIDEPTRAYVCMTAAADTPRYFVYVNHALFGNGGKLQLVGDNSRNCSQQPDPQDSGPAICRKSVRRFVTEGSRLMPVCLMTSIDPPLPEPGGCTSTPYNFAGLAQIFTSWKRQLTGPSIQRQWLVPVRTIRVN